MSDTELLQLFIDWVENEHDKQGYDFTGDEPIKITDSFYLAIAVNSLRHHRMREPNEQ